MAADEKLANAIIQATNNRRITTLPLDGFYAIQVQEELHIIVSGSAPRGAAQNAAHQRIAGSTGSQVAQDRRGGQYTFHTIQPLRLALSVGRERSSK
jgi:hypothetical protein